MDLFINYTLKSCSPTIRIVSNKLNNTSSFALFNNEGGTELIIGINPVQPTL